MCTKYKWAGNSKDRRTSKENMLRKEFTDEQRMLTK